MLFPEFDAGALCTCLAKRHCRLGATREGLDNLIDDGRVHRLQDQVFLKSLCDSQILAVFGSIKKVGLELLSLNWSQIVVHVIINQIVLYALGQFSIVPIEKEPLPD